ncbi:kinesin-like protein KIF13A isoform X1 [Anastrepha ludens]|uniref:kinesin-like protein KIF13A isoform X1 n=1 Tax=Anastrepha ludens TaxID=28586 RepID=UPI0023B1F5ED|nr:kinesin-like protein KIF13A isoform X1 [Anastrepha ludens]XP_053965382.1 kinesin-like protein KIF13A isoform X1 [Anastrepha ludens]XP_053965383.1 kinesin-like protein KIF13A isoform X1 [Anastrepha ludens]XP_053965384.1 kinesin-like protein KIF13A isoform X1 [Anastrepha ludens]XP_053965386.1 kinesin-like protein KIF13A isoform X1 [Anastrepha ludens]XP_053965387.1 kinesin-like protein KIF13A isoform X1 [Anastrepha ludens]
MSTDKIKVAVRVRPFNRREIELGTKCIVEMEKQQTVLQNPPSLDKLERKPPKTFAFDHCFYSLNPEDTNFASQESVFNCVGRDILDNAFQGYNACIFAYGQTGSGKSYTMMGSLESKGIIPRLCDELFSAIANKTTQDLMYKVEVSYMEIYNEKVHDLLDPKPNKQSLKVREHNVLGPYVDGLSQLAVSSYKDIDNLMTEGNKSRTVAATNMNAESSRSHAVFSVVLTQILTDQATGVSGEKVSRMSLVDLAGSERAVKTGAVGDRLKEGSNINKSLTTLGLVISKLADQSNGKKGGNDKFVPYRDSVLTWLLKDNLGGNSKTVMVATISPSADNYEETLSTLRYADRAKRIVNHAVVNEDPNARIIRELRLEVEALRNMLKHATGSPVGDVQRVDIHDKLAESENLMKQISQTWEEKLVKTERIQNERQQALEKMGISVQASGIKVEKNKYYLVNLNADPSLNELLVYYLKERTLIGGHSISGQQPDIQLSGLGIQPEHCVIVIEDGGLFMEPIQGARCFVNGSAVLEKIPLHNGDRILWGNHHFFRVNCPKSANANMISEPQTPAQLIDYNFARDEIMQNELSNDPIQTAIARLERQHEEDKQVALEKQRQEYERQFQQLRNTLSPSTPYAPYAPYDPLRLGKITPNTPTSQMRVEKWAQERDEMFKRSLGQLKNDIMRANALVQEANFLAEEMEKKTKFSVTLQIPPANLSPNRRRGAFVSEPAILVKRTNSGSQIWTMEKLENKLIDMREMYQEHKERILNGLESENSKSLDPFYESQENHNLIGVANIFLEVLFHDVKLDYHTPIISQQGEVAGRLQVEIQRIAGQMPQDRMCESISESSTDSRDEYDDPVDPMSNQITCRVSIKSATGLPLSLSNFVFCQYTFWGNQETVVPVINAEAPSHDQNMVFKFEHSKDFTVTINEEFLEHCIEGALSIEVWGHRSAGFSKTKGWEVEQQQAKARSLVDRWAELSRKIELWVEIHELNDNGEYSPVEVTNRTEVLTGGIYQLRQGQQRRVNVRVKPVQNSGTLPIICQSIVNIAIGSICVRSRLQRPLDSYQEEDLTVLREKWSEALGRRRQYLDQQIQKLIKKEDKSEEERERELSLVHQWVSLTEERNAVLVPAPGSGIPGAPASWDPPAGMEPHVPVLFLNLNADDMSAQNTNDEFSVAGLNSILSKEHGHKFYTLQILQHLEKDVCSIASWDSSMHDSQALNRVTEANERVYLILRTTVRLSHPAPMDLVLRKRISINIKKGQSITDRLKKFRLVRGENAILQTGVTYEVVSNIPKASEELEDRESLAQLAASGDDCSASDGETYIEKYTRGVSAVESILTLDRLRQSVAVKELETAHGQPLSMRKTVSVPNFSQAVKETTTGSLMRFDASMESLLNVGRSESFADLNNQTLNGKFPAHQAIRDFGTRNRHSFGGKSSNDEPPCKPFGIASPATSKLLGMRMTTLHEEPLGVHRALAEEPEDSYSDSEYTAEYELEKNQQNNYHTRSRLTASKTMDSFMDVSNHSNNSYLSYTSSANANMKHLTGLATPSMSSSTSSGYGSQAVSCSNLTNDDIASMRSMSIDETPDFNSNSPPNRQARFNPFLKDMPKSNGNKQQQQTQSTTPHPAANEEQNEMPQTQSKVAPETATHTEPTAEIIATLNDNDANNTNNAMLPNTIPKAQYTAANADVTAFMANTINDDDVVELKNNNNCETTTTAALLNSKHNNSENNKNTTEKCITMNIATDNQNGNDTMNTAPALEAEQQQHQQQTLEGNGIVRGQLPPGKVVRRKKTPPQGVNVMSSSVISTNNNGGASRTQLQRASVAQMEGIMTSLNDRLDVSMTGSMELEAEIEVSLPDWVQVGESVLIRPYNTSGVISYIGTTHFQAGTWIGVELDTPTGKNDGTVQGIQYFQCKSKHGIFVRYDKLILDKRGKAMRAYKAEKISSKESAMTRSKSRGESLASVGGATSSRK